MAHLAMVRRAMARSTPPASGGLQHRLTRGLQRRLRRVLQQSGLCLAATTLIAGNAAAFGTVAPSSGTSAKQMAGVAQVDTQRLVNADGDTRNWMTYGRTYDEQRHSPLRQIDATNVKRLGLAWEASADSNRGVQATPIIVDGVMYVTGSWSVVFALDAATGRVLWKYDPAVPRGWGVKSCCDVINRGVAVWNGKVYVGTFDGRLVAIDAASGQRAWETDTLIDRSKFYTITGAPRVVKGKVIIGNAGAEYGVRGYVSAFDAETGKLAWRFYTVPGDPKKPFEHPELEMASKTWEGMDWSKSGGGGTVWDSMAYDPELDLLYIGTGNGGPWSKTQRNATGGDNLFLASILALDPDTGRMKWFYQTTPGDNWDYTATQHIMLADIRIKDKGEGKDKGKIRKVLMQAPKNGFFYILDRATGELLSAEKYVAINWASHVDMKTGRPVLLPHGDYDKQARLVLPGPPGGHNWQPMAYNPATGLVYIPTREIPWAFGDHVQWYDKGRPDMDELRKRDLPKRPLVSGALKAWDPVTGKARWQVNHKTGNHSGVLSTAGNLIVQGGPDGRLSFFAADDGRLLHTLETGTSLMAPPVTYMIDGVQYIAMIAGFGGPDLNMMDEANSAAQRYSNEARILAFRLDGAPVPLPPLRADPGPIPEPPGIDASAAVIAKGEYLYNANCGRCHGIYGTVPLLPDLRHMQPETHAIFEQIVLDGYFEAKGMASFKDSLSREDVQAIHAYIVDAARKARRAESEKSAAGK